MPKKVENPVTEESVNEEGKKTFTTVYERYTAEERHAYKFMLSCGHPSIDDECVHDCLHEFNVEPVQMYAIDWDEEKQTYFQVGERLDTTEEETSPD